MLYEVTEYQTRIYRVTYYVEADTPEDALNALVEGSGIEVEENLQATIHDKLSLDQVRELE